MAKKPQTKPRKHATQERSRETVEALLEATTRILVKDGFDKASTNRIAEEAGVSIGSLYQYYPNKEALVVAVIERHQRELLAVVRDAFADVVAQPVDVVIQVLVSAAIEAHRIDPKLHRVLAEQLPRMGRLENIDVFNREAYALFKAYLESQRDTLRLLDLDLAAYICVTSIEALTHTAVLHHGETFTDARAEALIAESTRLVVGYLK